MIVPFAWQKLGESQLLRILDPNGAENRIILMTGLRVDMTQTTQPTPPFFHSEPLSFFAGNTLLLLMFLHMEQNGQPFVRSSETAVF